MVAFWMCELAPTEVAISDAWKHNQSVCRMALTHARPKKVGHALTSRRALRVLVVDDDRDAADGIAKLTRRWGHVVSRAYDGPAALKVAAAQHPDVVLLNVEMPRMEGCQVARQLRRDFPGNECLIIGVLGRADERCHQQCWEAGIDLVLIKPVNPSVIETLLMLESARLNRSPAENTAVFTSNRMSQRSRIAADAAGGEQPKRRRNPGGSSC